jgi:hypothetical protein
MSDTTRYALHPELRLTALEDEGVVLHLGVKRYFTVNDTGLLILEALKQAPLGEAALVAALLDQYEVTEQVARETVAAFLEQCVAAAVVIAEPA